MFDRREIMTRAWELILQGSSKSEALRVSWAEARRLKRAMKSEVRSFDLAVKEVLGERKLELV